MSLPLAGPKAAIEKKPATQARRVGHLPLSGIAEGYQIRRIRFRIALGETMTGPRIDKYIG